MTKFLETDELEHAQRAMIAWMKSQGINPRNGTLIMISLIAQQAGLACRKQGMTRDEFTQEMKNLSRGFIDAALEAYDTNPDSVREA